MLICTYVIHVPTSNCLCSSLTCTKVTTFTFYLFLIFAFSHICLTVAETLLCFAYKQAATLFQE